jgi:hypothetical protein
MTNDPDSVVAVYNSHTDAEEAVANRERNLSGRKLFLPPRRRSALKSTK